MSNRWDAARRALLRQGNVPGAPKSGGVPSCREGGSISVTRGKKRNVEVGFPTMAAGCRLAAGTTSAKGNGLWVARRMSSVAPKGKTTSGSPGGMLLLYGPCVVRFMMSRARTQTPHSRTRKVPVVCYSSVTILQSTLRHAPRRGAIGAASQGGDLPEDAVRTGDPDASGRQVPPRFARNPRPDPPDRPRPVPLFP